MVDESTLTGEPLPALRERGDHVRSGTANAGDVFELRAIRPAAESAYAAVVRLVREAESQRAPFVRLADRYAIFFLPLTIAGRGTRLGALGRSGPRARRVRRRDAVPADPGRADRALCAGSRAPRRRA